MPESGFWVNVDASWKGGIVTGGCDEGCAAYVMAELQDEAGSVYPGHERSKCISMNTTQIRMPLRWAGSPVGPVRFYFRDATIYALGAL